MKHIAIFLIALSVPITALNATKIDKEPSQQELLDSMNPALANKELPETKMSTDPIGIENGYYEFLVYCYGLTGRSPGRIITLLNANIANKSTPCEFLLGKIYFDGLLGVKKNIPLGEQLLRDAAKKGDAYAKIKLSRIPSNPQQSKK